MLKPILVSPDCTSSEAMLCMTQSLTETLTATDAIFDKLEERLKACDLRSKTIKSRLDNIHNKIKTLEEPNETTLTYPSKYPNGRFNPLFAIFEPITFPQYNTNGFNQSNGRKVEEEFNFKAAIDRKKDFGYAFDGGKHLEPLKNLKDLIDERRDFGCDLIDADVIFAEKKAAKGRRIVDDAEPDCLLIYKTSGKASSTDPFDYKPELGALNTFDFPEMLPQLPGISPAGQFAQNDWIDDSIAPSARDSIISQQNRVSSVDLTTVSGIYVKSGATGKPVKKEVKMTPLPDLPDSLSIITQPKIVVKSVAEAVEQPAPISTTAPPPPPPPPPPATMPTPVPPSPIAGPSSPPPPPPPPLPPSVLGPLSPLADSSKGRNDLMEAIRAAGGSKKAKLKTVNTADKSIPLQSPSKSLGDTGDDLMTSLSKALAARRRGMSGNTKKKFSHFDAKQSGISNKSKGHGDGLDSDRERKNDEDSDENDWS